jgi:polyphosphate glucokinase
MIKFFGIDIGCSSIKYGEVTFDQEISLAGFDSVAIPPGPGEDKFIQALTGLLQGLSAYRGVGIGFPSSVRGDQVVNLSIRFNDIWASAATQIRAQNTPCFAINDADAAGIAEVYRYEAVRLRKGVCVVITLGSGIGSAVFLEGRLLPNTELGLIEMHGMPAEKYTAAAVKTREDLSLEEWASRLQEYLSRVEVIVKPDTLVLAGGISADFEQYAQLITTRARLLPAFYRNQAGVIGAAMYAADRLNLYPFQT